MRLHAPASPGARPVNVQDLLLSATEIVLNQALATYVAQHGAVLNESQCWLLGCACAAVSEGFAVGIGQSEEWLLIALQSAERLLTVPLGLAGASEFSARSVQSYLDSREAARGPREFGAMARAASYAMIVASPAALKIASQLVSQRILARRQVPAFVRQVASG